jgi:hypothetical protein
LIAERNADFRSDADLFTGIESIVDQLHDDNDRPVFGIKTGLPLQLGPVTESTQTGRLKRDAVHLMPLVDNSIDNVYLYNT